MQAAKDEQATTPEQEKPKGVCLDFQSDSGFKLQLDSLESRRSGIELRNSRTDEDGVMHGTVFVPEGKVGIFVRKFERYAKENDAKSGKPSFSRRTSRCRKSQSTVPRGRYCPSISR